MRGKGRKVRGERRFAKERDEGVSGEACEVKGEGLSGSKTKPDRCSANNPSKVSYLVHGRWYLNRARAGEVKIFSQTSQSVADESLSLANPQIKSNGAKPTWAIALAPSISNHVKNNQGLGFDLWHLLGSGLEKFKRHPPGLELQDAIQEQADFVKDSGGGIEGLRWRVHELAGPGFRTPRSSALRGRQVAPPPSVD